MKGIFFIIGFFFVTFSNSAQSIAIQEVLYDQAVGSDKFELVNTTGGTINISTYFLCVNFNYMQLNSTVFFEVLEGNLNMGPGSHIKMRLKTYNLNNTQGDFCIYSDMCFTCTTSMIDFIQWGSNDPNIGRASVAINKGIWRDMDGIMGAPYVVDFIPTVTTPGYSTNWDGSNNGGGELTWSTDFTNGPPTLPISLLTLSGRVNMDKQVLLEWIALDEINSQKHLVEKSINGQTFDVIGEVTSQNLGSTPAYYYFLDKSPAINEFNYYRIRQIDFDGDEAVSSTLYLKVKGTSKNPGFFHFVHRQ